MTIRRAFSNWERYNRVLTEAVSSLTDEQLAMQPSPDRWPLWATIGHLACQRVSWLCGFAGEPGADGTPFPDAQYRCPGDEYLEPAMSASSLSQALGATFGVVESVLDRWTLGMLDEEIHPDVGDDPPVYTRGSVIQRVFAHDVYHIAELNESLAGAGLPLIELWD